MYTYLNIYSGKTYKMTLGYGDMSLPSAIINLVISNSMTRNY